MFTVPNYSETLSVYLSRVLDEAGLNERTVTSRRRLHMQMETRSNVIALGLEGKKRTTFNFGSQTEGTTTVGLNSDLDNLFCMHEFHIIQNWDEWEQGKVTLLVLQDNDVAPGYCRLQVVLPEAPIALTVVPPVKGMVYDEFGRFLITNAMIHTKMLTTPGMQRSGPAGTRTNMDGLLDDDTVVAFKSNSWPTGSLGWLEKKRPGHWPTPKMINFCLESGCFLVPVGHRLSDTESLEWRISPSLAERCLMFSMNIVQIKCYVVVKLLMKTYVTPRVGKSISSFHCKTAMFYCIENTSPALWVGENLLLCVTQCLFVLLEWVKCGYCPQYFNPNENLFAGKIKDDIRGSLIHILERLIKSNGCCMLNVQYDDIGKLLTEKMSSLDVPSVENAMNSYWSVGLLSEFVMRGKYNSALIHRYVINHFEGTQTKDAVRIVLNFSKKLLTYRKKHPQAEPAVEEILPYMYTTLGSLISSQILGSGGKIPKEVFRLFKRGNQSDLASSRLKLAAVYHCCGQLSEASKILSATERRLTKRLFMPACGCYGVPTNPKPDTVLKWVDFVPNSKEKTLVSHCVIFSPQEVFCIPKGLQYEMYRAFGDEDMNRTRRDRWMNWAVADSLPFLYYVQFLTYGQLSELEKKKQALDNLITCVSNDPGWCHPETALNLIGQCMEMEGKPETAMEYYRKSLEVRPRNNAANWHIKNLSDGQKVG